jgi:thiamine biosynthesis lipoprotein
MGTTYNISIVGNVNNDALHESNVKDIKSAVDTKLISINQLMSTYIDDSEISRFNQLAYDEWFTLSVETLEVIEYSLYLSEVTNGKFDITVSPLINLWGFGSQGETAFPSDSLIAEAKEKVGWESLILDKDNQRIKKTKPLTIDLSAIAKGYGVDVITQLLEGRGIDNYLVEIGGEIRVKGSKPDGQLWRVGIETPSFFQQGARKVLTLNNVAVATSGDYRNFFEKDGVRYSHTIDPLTGKPVIHNIASITVIVDSAVVNDGAHNETSSKIDSKVYSAMKADGLATAFMALGEEGALELANRLALPIYILRYNEEMFTESFSSSFVSYLDH